MHEYDEEGYPYDVEIEKKFYLIVQDLWKYDFPDDEDPDDGVLVEVG